LEFLLENSKNKDLINQLDSSDKSVLHLASENGNLEIIDLLIKFNAKLDICGKINGQTALHLG
jgi:ankyrin repeat protein